MGSSERYKTFVDRRLARGERLVRFFLPIRTIDRIKGLAHSAGKTMQEWYTEAVNEKLDRDHLDD